MYATLWTISVSLGWGAVMFVLLRDELPGWTGTDSPPPTAQVAAGYEESFELFSERPGAATVEAFDESGVRVKVAGPGARQRLGSASVRHQIDNMEHRRIVDTDWIVDKPPPPIAGRLIVRNQVRRREDGRIDGFETEINAEGWQAQAKIIGNVSGGRCRARLDFRAAGLQRKFNFDFPLNDGGTDISGEFQSLALMPDLKVGQTWSVKLINAQAVLSKLWKSGLLGEGEQPGADDTLELTEPPFETFTAKVTGEETILWDGRAMAVKVVQMRSSGGQVMRTYVARDGRVLRQDVDGFNGKTVTERLRTRCPVCREPGKPADTVAHEGRRAPLCSPACRGKWDALGASDKTDLLNRAKD